MSFFLKLYKYRQTEKINQLENFCTEILSYCLRVDNNFRKSFLQLIDKKINYKSETFSTITQSKISGSNERPDIILESNNYIVFVENKIESPEGREQIKRYKRLLILKFQHKKKYLVYITKYAVLNFKEGNHNNVISKHIFWSELFKIIPEKNDQIASQFKTFVQNTVMKRIRQVSQTHISSLIDIKNILESYDGFFNEYKEKLRNKYNISFYKSNLTKNWVTQNLNNNNLITEIKLEQSTCLLWFGIYLMDDTVFVGVQINFPLELNKKIGFIKNKLIQIGAKNYEEDFNDITFDCIYFSKDLKEFVSKNVNELEKWYDKQFKIIFDLINKSGLKFTSQHLL